MKYSELKKEIKKASKQQKVDGIQAYIAYNDNERLSCNFIDSLECLDSQLIKAQEEGLLKRDWDVLEVA